MGFLKRILGRDKWEQVADEVELEEGRWEEVPYADPTPSMGASQAPPPPPGAAPPPPKFQPGAAPSAPPPKFQPGVVQAGVPARTEPVPPAPEPVPSIAPSAPVSMSRAPEPTREVILDTIDDDDETMPEEFRGCRVVERTQPDGRVEVVYKGPDGFTVDESAAEFLISAYKEELATLTPKAAEPHPVGDYSAPVPSVQAPEPRLMGSSAPEPHVPVTDEVIDELGYGTDLPPELRGARFVRRGGVFQYVTKDGSRLDKDQAENRMEAWEQEQSAKQPPAPLVIDVLGLGADLPPELRGASFVNDGSEFLYITQEGTRYSKDMAEGMMERWERDQTERAQASLPVAAPQPEVEMPFSASTPAPVAVTTDPVATPPPRFQPDAQPVPPPTPAPEPSADENVGDSIGDAVRKRAESGLLPQAPPPTPVPSVATPAPTAPPTPAPVATTPAPAAPSTPAPAMPASPVMTPPPRADRGAPAPVGADPRFPVRPVQAPEDPTQETPIDGVTLAEAQRAAERIRERVLEDEDAAYQAEVPASRLQQACESEIDRKRTRHRFEHMLTLSEQARDALVEAWAKSSERKHRDVTKDLGQDMLVLGLFNPMTMRDIDLAEFLSLARLRSSERRRGIITGELSRRVAEQAPGELHQFCMTRAFVDRVARAAMDSPDETPKILEQVLNGRLQESVEAIVAEVTKRHGIWLPGLAERLSKRLAPLVRGLVKLGSA